MQKLQEPKAWSLSSQDSRPTIVLLRFILISGRRRLSPLQMNIYFGYFFYFPYMVTYWILHLEASRNSNKNNNSSNNSWGRNNDSFRYKPHIFGKILNIELYFSVTTVLDGQNYYLHFHSKKIEDKGAGSLSINGRYRMQTLFCLMLRRGEKRVLKSETIISGYFRYILEVHWLGTSS